MFGSVNYFTERLKSVVMNRLVVNNSVSLEQSYKNLQQEIVLSNASDERKKLYDKNLVKAFEKIMELIYGIEEELELI